MLKKAIAVFLILCLLAGQVSPIDSSAIAEADGKPRTFKVIDDYLQEQMRQQSIEGLSYAIVENHKIIHENAFGQADLGRPMTPQIPVRLASLSKSFTALAVMQLVEQGKVKLDVPVKTYLPWFSVDDSAATSTMTIRNLLNQVSGLSGEGETQLENEFSGLSMEETVRLLKKVKTVNQVGAKFHYTNFNYIILGMVVQMVSGERFDRYIEKHIFKPIGMKNSFTSLDKAKKHGLAKSFAPWFGLMLPTKNSMEDRPNFLASGYMAASAEDMGKYLLVYMDGGKANNGKILSPEGIRELQQPAAAAKMMRSGKVYAQYAMGWWSRKVQGVPVVGHAGDLLSTCRTDMYILTKQHIGIVILTNSHTGSLVPGNLHASTDGAISLLAGKKPPINSNGAKFMRYYFLFDTVVLLILIVFLRAFLELTKWEIMESAENGKIALNAMEKTWLGIQFVVPLLLLACAPSIFQFPSWTYLFSAQPDMVSSLLAILAAISVHAGIKSAIVGSVPRRFKAPGD